jgi:hypothetical protein
LLQPTDSLCAYRRLRPRYVWFGLLMNIFVHSMRPPSDDCEWPQISMVLCVDEYVCSLDATWPLVLDLIFGLSACDRRPARTSSLFLFGFFLALLQVMVLH